MKIFKFLITLWLILSSSVILSAAKANDKSYEYEDYVHEIINDIKKEAKKKLGLICIGRGGRMPDGKVEEIDVEFVLYCKGTIEEARRLEVEATEILLKKM